MIGETAPNPDDGDCDARDDGKHCSHWFDGSPCCACGHDGGAVDSDEGEAS